MDHALPRRQTSPELVASWERSRELGLVPDQPLPDAPIARGELNDRLEANARLLTFSRPVIENLYRQIGSPSSTVLLADSQGLILSTVGDTDFLDRAAQVALSPGAQWTEATMGTNAIGTALHARATITVRGQEHYLERNRFLSCVATPILAPNGGVLGILDVSTDARGNISHADALLRTTAELIEHRLIENLDEGFVTLRFHRHAELLGSPLEALAVFDETGRLIASNRPARGLLGLDPERPAASCEECFATPWFGLVGWAALRQNTPFPLRTRRGHTFAAHASLPSRRERDLRRARSPAPHSASRLEAMCLGDPRIASVVEVLQGLAGSLAPLLVEGETGSGKTHVMRAFQHDHGPGTGASLVELDCPAIVAAGNAEDELRAGLERVRPGMLLLKEIGALPLALQAQVWAHAGGVERLRIAATTTRPLADLAAAGDFDLPGFEVAGGHLVSLPPLRERSDFDAIVRMFVREACPDRTIYVCADALARLHQHAWPGNLRELNNQLRLILALMGDDAGQMCPEDIPSELFEEDEAD